ncbi:2-dehydro-3-deoxygluconokinase [Allocatelliglobosispora scoriae]|uniref:2-dehydro-3-deoxygluconokinase n=1 Tax=Allocatelliglobosispora scoriae TaxID=643052 RepID=A0A841C3X4_9ACTN|nr:sugar kinase [Allocatelliglobosispora scoriae]MBB5874468.1 2-dehydro-3-deoxygluconokinase [Allocatelliglobosispora scoriae]
MITDGLDVVGFGEAMVLMQPPIGADLRSSAQLGVHVAGAELNLCAAVARVGLAAGLCSRVGADPLGERVADHARALGVDTGLVLVDPDHPTGLFLKDVRPDGERRVHYYRRGSAASTMDSADARRLLAARPAVVAVSGITAALGPGPLRGVRTLLREARAAGTAVAFDPNLRPALGDLDGQIALARELLASADYLLIGVEEAEAILGTADPAAVFRAASAAGVGETVLKAGADGCYHADGDRIVHLPSAASTVVDPVGGGDAFGGGYLAARLRGASPAGAAWLGSRLAAGVVAAAGDTDGLPDGATARALLARVVPRKS